MPAPKEISPERWNHIVACFAKHDGRLYASARELGWPVARTRRVLEFGYPSIGYPSVKSLLALDHAGEQAIRAARADIEAERSKSSHEAMAELVEAAKRTGLSATRVLGKARRTPEDLVREQEEPESHVLTVAEQRRVAALVKREEERDKARTDAIKARGEEATLVSASRRNALALNAVTAQVLNGAIKLAARIQTALEVEASASTLSLRDQLALVRQAAQIARFNAEAGLQAVKSERIALGQAELPEPGEHVNGSLEDAESWIVTTTRALQRARDRGLMLTATVTNAVPNVSPGIQMTNAEGSERPAPQPPDDDIDEADEQADEAEELDLPEPAEPTETEPDDLVAQALATQPGQARLPTAREERGLRRIRSRPGNQRGRLVPVLTSSPSTPDAE